MGKGLTRIDDKVVDKWVLCLPQPKTAILSLLGRKPDGLSKTKRTGVVKNDDRIDWGDTYSLFPGDIAYIWHAGRHASEVQASIERCGFEIRCQIIWAKPKFRVVRSISRTNPGGSGSE